MHVVRASAIPSNPTNVAADQHEQVLLLGNRATDYANQRFREFIPFIDV